MVVLDDCHGRVGKVEVEFEVEYGEGGKWVIHGNLQFSAQIWKFELVQGNEMMLMELSKLVV